MNNQETMVKMKELRLHGMQEAFRNALDIGMDEKLTADEVIAHLVDAEWNERYNSKLERLLKKAQMRYRATLHEINYDASRNIDKKIIMRLASCDWITKAQNIIITGKTGTGKSFLACVLGQQACQQGLRVNYFNCMKLFSNLKIAKADGSYGKVLRNIQKQDVLILDDFGMKTFDQEARLALFEMLDDRAGEKSTIVVSQFPPKKWFEIIGEPTIADAVCDRLVHNAHKIDLEGDSLRRLKAKKSGQNLPPQE